MSDYIFYKVNISTIATRCVAVNFHKYLLVGSLKMFDRNTLDYVYQ